MATSFTELLDAIVDFLQDLSALVTMCGEDASNISAYKDGWATPSSVESALRQQKAGTVLVVHHRTGPSEFGKIPATVHDFSLFLRAADGVSISAMWSAIRDGGFRSPAEDIHANVLMVQDSNFQRRSQPVTDTASVDYFEALFSLTEKLG